MEKKNLRRRWLVMQVMDGAVAIVGYAQLRRVMIFGTRSPYDGTSTCYNVPNNVLYPR